MLAVLEAISWPLGLKVLLLDISTSNALLFYSIYTFFYFIYFVFDHDYSIAAVSVILVVLFLFGSGFGTNNINVSIAPPMVLIVSSAKQGLPVVGNAKSPTPALTNSAAEQSIHLETTDCHGLWLPSSSAIPVTIHH